MSHFLVMVIGDDPDYQLAPFHEYECTGLDDEFVVVLDQTAETTTRYEESVDSYIKYADGTMVSPYDIPTDQLTKMSAADEIKWPAYGFNTDGTHVRSGEWDGDRQTRLMYKLPDGAEVVEALTKEVKTFVEWLADDGIEELPPNASNTGKYNWYTTQPDGSVLVFRKTNPSAHWDWYAEGGRWGSPLILKNGDEVSQATKGDLDLNEMIQRPTKAAGEAWDWVHSIAPEPWRSWEEVLAEYCPKDEEGKAEVGDGKIEEARFVYHDQPQIKLLEEADPKHQYHGFMDGWDKYLQDRATYTQLEGLQGLCAYAYVLNREWHERGSMGWFGMSSNEQPLEEWQAQFAAMFDALPDDSLITMIDCHI